MKTRFQCQRQRICRPARGFGIVTAVFLLVVLAGLGAALVNLTTVQHTTSSLDIQGARAYQAARAGIEWGLFRQLRNNNCAASSSFVVPANGFTVTVQCILTVGPGALQRFQVVAVACNQPVNGDCTATATSTSSDYVRRSLQAEF
ncbi:pilus assembly PilX N-terminal domain-containing protein [Janthinobacterium psychrotolerans]|uniref:MSHA biogenesis protein MshP n=1 Tax=Janthinobacterium psychrotolerans TaxID=1747903 RepID=A0A1A7BXD1_9BURK|nr:agglutinin biogenesis protein MshP [Janthinobacterium psychrotolerans]OBV38261.1 MSHA biogenesis protein MshP [Janthinobacterium psychrotolerans]